MDSFIRAVTFLSRVAGVIGALLIGLAVLVICDMVIERYVFNLTTIWQIDVVTYCIVGATFVGSPYVLMTRGHVNVDILPLHRRPARALLACAVHQPCCACLLHRDLHALHGLLVRGLSRKLAVQYCLARAALDSLSLYAGRTGPCWSCNTWSSCFAL